MSALGVFEVLDSSLEPGTFALIGAFARNVWAPPRNTADVDFVIAADRAVIDKARVALERAGHVVVREQRADSLDELPDILIFRKPGSSLKQVDLLVGKTPFEASALRRAVRVAVAGAEQTVVTPEDLIVYKLLADRPRDRDDISAVLATLARSNRELDWDYIDQWAHFWEIGARARALRANVEPGSQ